MFLTRNKRSVQLLAFILILTLLFYVFQYYNSGASWDASLRDQIAEMHQEISRNVAMINIYLSEIAQLKRLLKTSGTSNRTDVLCTESIPVLSQADITMDQKYHEIKFNDEEGGVWRQGWPYENDDSLWTEDNPLRVFVIPHSHQDPGWLRTYEQYFTIQTKPILDSTFSFLSENPDARFIYAEMSFLSMWWSSADTAKREQLKKILANGQLEIVSGGWVMNDEANTHIFAMIEQLTEGHQWLDDELDYRPKASWAIDPFGHSTTMAYLVNRMNISRMLIQRTHYEVKRNFARNKQLEFRWRQSWDRRGETEVLCHMMPFYAYDIPHTCGPDPSVCCAFDFARLNRWPCPWTAQPTPVTSANVAQQARKILDQYKKKAMLYQRHNVLLVPLGDDFRYETVSEWRQQFRNYKKLFEYINSQPSLRTNISFGTLSDYFEEVERRGRVSFPSLTGDMFTYADRVQDYWSGYFTSRPFHKRLTRVLENRVYGADVLYSLAQHQPSAQKQALESVYQALSSARRSLSLFQHHDGVTGTAKDAVVIDYGNKMLQALRDADMVAETSVRSILGVSEAKAVTDTWALDSIPKTHTLQVSKVPEEIDLQVFNPTLHEKSAFVRLILSPGEGLSLAKTGLAVICLNNGSTVSSTAIQLPSGALAVTIGPLYSVGAWTFHPIRISLTNGATNLPIPPVDMLSRGEKAFSIKNGLYRLDFDGQTNLLKSVTNLQTGSTVLLRLSFWTYPSQRSGAYLFLPSGPAQPYAFKSARTFVKEEGKSYEAVVLSDGVVTHTVRLYHDTKDLGQAIEVENVVNIPYNRDSSLEYTMRIETVVKNTNRVIYTDSNCHQFIRREYNEKIPIQGNVYPMSCSAFIEDGEPSGSKRKRITVASGQPLGVSALAEGTMEIFLERHLLQDDARGVAQGVTDNRPTRSIFRIIPETIEEGELPRKDVIPTNSFLAERLLHDLLRPVQVFTVKCATSSCEKDLSLMPMQVPSGYQLINLKTYLGKRSGLPQVGFVIRRIATGCEQSSSTMALTREHFAKSFPGVQGFKGASITMIESRDSTQAIQHSLVLKKMDLACFTIKLS